MPKCNFNRETFSFEHRNIEGNCFIKKNLNWYFLNQMQVLGLNSENTLNQSEIVCFFIFCYLRGCLSLHEESSDKHCSSASPYMHKIPDSQVNRLVKIYSFTDENTEAQRRLNLLLKVTYTVGIQSVTYPISHSQPFYYSNTPFTGNKTVCIPDFK